MAINFSKRWLRNRIIALGVIILLIDLAVPVFHLADRILLLPSREPLDVPGAGHVTLQVSGKRLDVLTERSPACNGGEPAAFVLVLNGNASRAEDLIEDMAEQRYRRYPVEVWAMNYPGYGNSDGPARLRDLPPLTLATYDMLKQRAGDRPIVVDGTSIGTTCALYLAANRPVAALVLQDPPPLQRMIVQRYGWWNAYLLAGPLSLAVPREMNSTINAPKVSAPACFLLSDHDQVVPPYYHQIVVDAFGGPKTVIDLPDATHSAPVDAASNVKLQAWIAGQWARLGLADLSHHELIEE